MSAFILEMYLHHHSFLLILTFLNSFPASLSAPTIDPNAGVATVDCDNTYPIPGQPSWYHIPPFPSHCRSLANQIAILPDAQTLLPFDKRYPTSGAGRFIPVPYCLRYETCVAAFFPPKNPAPGTANPNLAKYADLANIVTFSIKTCFDAIPGQEYEDEVVAFGKYAGFDGNAWTAVLTGPVVTPRSTGGNFTVMDEGLSSSFNGSLIMAGGENGTSATERVDVT